METDRLGYLDQFEQSQTLVDTEDYLTFGSGKEIIIRRDRILGTTIEVLYTAELTHCLNNNGYFYLDQTISSWSRAMPVWKEAREIELLGKVARRWEQIRTALQQSNICWEKQGDHMGFNGIMKQNAISVSDTYRFISCCVQKSHEVCLFTKFWKTKIPIKIVLFVWLAWRNKNLTWDNLRRGTCRA